MPTEIPGRTRYEPAVRFAATESVMTGIPDEVVPDSRILHYEFAAANSPRAIPAVWPRGHFQPHRRTPPAIAHAPAIRRKLEIGEQRPMLNLLTTGTLRRVTYPAQPRGA